MKIMFLKFASFFCTENSLESSQRMFTLSIMKKINVKFVYCLETNDSDVVELATNGSTTSSKGS